VDLIVVEDTTARLLKSCLACDIDWVLASQPIIDDRLELRELFTEELFLALPPGHPLIRRKTVSAADLEGENLIVMKEGHCLGDQVLKFCDLRDVQPRIGFRSAQLETVQALVTSGLGLSLVPAMAIKSPAAAGPVYRPFATPRPERKIMACWPKQRPPGRAAAELLKVVSEAAGLKPKD